MPKYMLADNVSGDVETFLYASECDLFLFEVFIISLKIFLPCMPVLLV